MKDKKIKNIIKHALKYVPKGNLKNWPKEILNVSKIILSKNCEEMKLEDPNVIDDIIMRSLGIEIQMIKSKNITKLRSESAKKEDD